MLVWLGHWGYIFRHSIIHNRSNVKEDSYLQHQRPLFKNHLRPIYLIKFVLHSSQRCSSSTGMFPQLWSYFRVKIAWSHGSGSCRMTFVLADCYKLAFVLKNWNGLHRCDSFFMLFLHSYLTRYEVENFNFVSIHFYKTNF